MMGLQFFQSVPEVCVSKVGQVPAHHLPSPQAALWRTWVPFDYIPDFIGDSPSPNSISSPVEKDQGKWPQRTSLAFPPDYLRKRSQPSLDNFWEFRELLSRPLLEGSSTMLCACVFIYLPLCAVLVCIYIHVHACVFMLQPGDLMCTQTYIFICVWAFMAALRVHMYRYTWGFMGSPHPSLHSPSATLPIWSLHTSLCFF